MDDDEMPDFGQIAYTAYGDDRDWKTYGDQPMPAWDDQAPELRHAWRAAASAVVEAIG